MAVDSDVAFRRSDLISGGRLEVPDNETEAGVPELQGGFPDLSKTPESLGQAGPLAIAIAIHGLDGGAEIAELFDREGGDEVPGVDDEIAARVVEQANGFANPDQIVVCIGDDTDHSSLPPLL